MSFTTLELGGQTRRLRFDMNAIVALEQRFGRPLEKFADLDATVEVIRAMLWAALLHEEPTITEREVGEMVALDQLGDITEAVNEAFLASLPTSAAAKKRKRVGKTSAPAPTASA